MSLTTDLPPIEDAAAEPIGRAAPTGREAEQSFGPAAMHCERSGSGKPLLLLHGIGGSSGSWRPILAGLARERSIVALDLPGFGRTALLTVPLTTAHMADQVTAFLRAHGLVGIDVVGASSGGRLALELARRGIVGSTVALGPSGFAVGWRRRLFSASVGLRIALLRRLRPNLPGLLRRPQTRRLLLLGISPRGSRLNPDLLLQEFEGLARLEGSDQLLRSLASGPVPLGAGGRPTGRIVVGWGRRDRICPPREARRVVELFPAAELHWFEAAGHYPVWDCPDEAVQLILRATG